jgi:hypothetical protein
MPTPTDTIRHECHSTKVRTQHSKSVALFLALFGSYNLSSSISISWRSGITIMAWKSQFVAFLVSLLMVAIAQDEVEENCDAENGVCTGPPIEYKEKCM